MAQTDPKLRFGRMRAVTGYAAGLRQQALTGPVTVRMPGAQLRALRAFRAALDPHLPDTPAAHARPALPKGDAAALLYELGEIAGLLQVGAGIPVIDTPRVRNDPQTAATPGATHHTLFLPCYANDATAKALSETLRLFQKHFEADATADTIPDWAAELDLVFDALENHAPKGSNPNIMMLDAAALNIPVLPQAHGPYVFGWGRHGRVFRGSISEATGTLATRIANDKRRTHLTLQAAGLPQPEQHHVTRFEDAEAHADRMGYPVVLKITDMEAGTGVESRLTDAAALRLAWDRLAAFDHPMVIKKHLPGLIYRVNVLDGEAVRFSVRTGASVTGDGTHSIAELIEITNRDPRRSDARFARMRPIRVTERAEQLLTEQGLTVKDIPEPGRAVLLSTLTNRADGGLNTALNPGTVHPDNALLAVRATKAVRLDIAGVDLLLPDIGQSWRNTGGAICEVNAGPDMSYVSRPKLRSLIERLPEGGRIPLDVVVMAGEEDDLADPLRSCLADADALIVNQDLEIIGDGLYRMHTVQAATRAAMMDRHVGRILVVAKTADLIRNGMVADRVDRVLVPGRKLDPDTQAAMSLNAREMVEDLSLDAVIDALGRA